MLMTLDTERQMLFTSSSSGALFKYSIEGEVISLVQTSDGGNNPQSISINPNMDYVVLPCGGGNGPTYNLYAFDAENLDNILGDFDIGTYPKFATFTRDGQTLLGLNGDFYDSYIYVMGAYTYSRLNKIYFPFASDYSRISANYSGSRIVASSYLDYDNNKIVIYFFNLK